MSASRPTDGLGKAASRRSMSSARKAVLTARLAVDAERGVVIIPVAEISRAAPLPWLVAASHLDRAPLIMAVRRKRGIYGLPALR
eukprot:scaffold71297_cov32-Tisochrysis_lutea.AAC.1